MVPSSPALRTGKSLILVLVASSVAQTSAAETQIRAPVVEVVGTSPVRGLEQPKAEIPLNVQSLDAKDLKVERRLPLPELLGKHISGVNVNEVQGNPYQADVNFRGYSASPLLGTPQGMSVFLDGVRINEPFGDTVNWDLVPHSALAGVDLIPGSNPLFGLNTLGGALVLHTKDGYAHTGGDLEVGAGSFGRRELEAEFGTRRENFGVYFAATAFREDGWRDFSPSRIGQTLGKFSHRSGPLEWDLTYFHADTDLVGNGLLPESMLRARRSSIFTKPDNTRHRLDHARFGFGYWLTEDARLTGTMYVRYNRAKTLNGDANDAFEGDAALDGDAGANGGAGFNRNTAANNRTSTDQRGWGAALQWSRIDDDNHVAFGLTADMSQSTFRQTTELGTFDAQRGVAAGGVGETLNNQLAGRTRSWGLFATDTYKPRSGVAITAALRLNQTRVTTLDDRRRTAPNLDGDHLYTKLNPALGATIAIAPPISIYANFAQGTRAPSPIELGCADRANPCSLPNAMQADPFLRQVVTRTFETGIRGKAGSSQWHATAFRADNRDDILFVGTSTSQGYFTNFGRTRREGVEVGLTSAIGSWSLRADYSFVKATYQSSACLLAENNSSRGQSVECTRAGQNNEILVRAGNRIPGIPLHSIKLGIDWRANDRLSMSTDLVAFSSQYLRGNENNQHQSGTFSDRLGGGPRTFLGPGKAAGYGVVNLSARLKLDKEWELAARISNLFDHRYATAGALAENPFDARGSFQTNSSNWTRESFFSPGAPRSLYVALTHSLY